MEPETGLMTPQQRAGARTGNDTRTDTMTNENQLDELESRCRKVRAMGGEPKLDARRRQGVMNARERVDAFFDPATFTEVGEFAHSPREGDRDRTPAEGIVTGFGRVDGREIAVAVAVMTTGEVGFVDPAVAMSVVHNRRRQEAGKAYDVLMKDMVVSNSPFELAGIFAAHAVIRPSETRDWLIRMLEVHRRRRSNGVGEHRLSSWPTSL